MTGDNWGKWKFLAWDPGFTERSADSTGHIGAQNFCLEWKNYFGSLSAKELGMAQFVVSYLDTGEKRPLAGIVFVKNTRASLNAIAELRVGNQIMKSIRYKCNSASKISGSKDSQLEGGKKTEGFSIHHWQENL